MNLLDLLIILCAVAYGFGGFRSGAVVGLFSTVGFFGGAVIGAQLAEPVGSALADGRGRVPVAIICVLFLAMVGQLAGVWVAGHVKSRVVVRQGIKAWDAGIGSGLGVVSVLLVAWMVAVPLRSSPYPELSSEATHSAIVKAVDGVMPGGVRNLYSSLRTFLDRSGFPRVFGDLPQDRIVAVAPPPSLSKAVRRRVLDSEKSIFKITSVAPSCGKQIEGSGFVFAPHRILTNAHVVAGADQVSVQAPGQDQSVTATVVVYDPVRDVAVLYAPDISAPPLPLAAKPATSGDPGVVLGYPEGGPFDVQSARVRNRLTVEGQDIYGNGTVDRDVYAIRSLVRSGNSGGPLLADDGQVLGVVFERVVSSTDTGYALTIKEIQPDVDSGRTGTSGISTGQCANDS